MKKICLFFILGLMFIPIKVHAEELDLAKNAKSAITIEASTGEIIYEKNAHEKLAPASMTKMLSLIIIMDNIESGKLKLDELVTTSAYASSMGGSQIYLKAGEKMSVDDLLKAICVASANDATVALAERIAGTEEAFIKQMNDYAKKLGLKNTVFKNTTGLDEANHYSSAYDMSLIAKELVRHPKILEYSGIYEDYLRTNTENKFWLVNTNKLVRFYQGVDGLKTGYTSEAGYCLTATAKKEGMRLITVVMGEPDSGVRNSETSKMLDYGFNMYSVEKMLSKDSILKKARLSKGEKEYVNIVPSEEVNILNNKSKDKRNVTYKVEVDSIKAPVYIGEIVGKLKVIENNKEIMNINLTVSEDIKKANIVTLYFRSLKNIVTGSIKN